MSTKSSFSRKPRQHRRTKTTHRRSHRLPVLQELEARQLMAAFSYANGTITIEAAPEGSNVVVARSFDVYETREGVEVREPLVWIQDGFDPVRTFKQEHVDTIRFEGDVGEDFFRVVDAFPSVRFELYGDEGGDHLTFGYGAQAKEDSIVDGGCDDDVITVHGIKAIAKGGSGNDTIHVLGDDNQAYGEQGDDTIIVGTDTIGAHGNIISGGDGGDTIRVLGNNNKVYGGGGKDIYEEVDENAVGNEFYPSEDLEPPSNEGERGKDCADPNDDGTPDPSEESGPHDSGEASQEKADGPGESAAEQDEAIRAALESLFADFEPIVTNLSSPIVLPPAAGESEVTLPIDTQSPRDGKLAEADPVVAPTVLTTATSPADDDSTVLASAGFDLWLKVLEWPGY